jgi:hypothetical protein
MIVGARKIKSAAFKRFRRGTPDPKVQRACRIFDLSACCSLIFQEVARRIFRGATHACMCMCERRTNIFKLVNYNDVLTFAEETTACSHTK